MARRNARPASVHLLAALLLAVLLSTPYLTAFDADAAGGATEVIRGVVYDERGEPLAGALVWCSLSQGTVRTDEQGRFEMAGEDLDGEGTLVVSAVGFLSTEVWYSLADGGVLVRGFYLVEREEDHVGDIEGRVVSVEQERVEGARVALSGEGFEATTFTDADGHYLFSDVPVTEAGFTLTVEARGFDTVVETVAVLPDRTQRVDVVLDYEGDQELVVGRVLDIRGLPLPGAVVTVSGAQGMWTTNLNGAFRIKHDAVEGHRDITVSLRGYTTLTTSVDVPDRGFARVDVTLTTDGSGGAETLWVLVTEMTSGSPLQDVTVSVEAHEGSWATDARGLAVIITEGLDGLHFVRAWRDGCSLSQAPVELEDGGSGSVSLMVAESSTATNLEGTVIDALTGVPVGLARVTLSVPGLERATVSGEDGAFRLHTLPPGITVTVTASAEGYVDSTTELVLREYEPNVVVLEMQSLQLHVVDIAVRVVDAQTGGFVPSVHVTVWDDGFRRVGRTDELGALRMSQVPVEGGRVLFLLQHQRYAAQSGERVLGPGARSVTIEATLTPISPPLTSIRGLVVDADGLPVEGASVALEFARSSWETVTGDDGGYELLLSMDADFTAPLTTNATGYIEQTLTLDLLAHELNWANVTLALGPSIGNVLGTIVVEGSLRPVDGAEVLLSRTGGHLERTTTDDSGAFAFQRVPAAEDEYTLSVIVEGLSGASIGVLVLPGTSAYHAVVLRELVPTTETVTGIVISTGGIPLAGAVVQVGPFGSMTAGADGRFTFTDPVLEGDRTLVVSAPGFEQGSVRIEVPPDATVEVVVVLEDAHADFAIVRGSVTDSEGNPLGGAVVQLGWPAAKGAYPMQMLAARDGTFTFLGVPTADGKVTVVGSVEGFHPDTIVLKVLPGQVVDAPLRLDLVELSPPEPAMTKEEKAAVGVSAGAVLATLGALLLTEVGRVALMGFFLLPLYTKIKREKMMDHFVRGRIYEHICNNPGVNFSAIKARFNLTNGTVTYHLSMLERQEFIRSKHDGIYKRYFKAGTAPGAIEQEPMSLQGAIHKLVSERPGLTQKDIARALGTSKQLVSYYVRNMRKEHLVETHREGRHVRVYPGPNRPS